jgi:Amt family ammonium transporter
LNGGYFGTPLPYSWPDAGAANEGDYSVASDWFFQMVFCAATASIVSGTLAERIKLWPFLIFTAILTGILYPISGSWQWGGGWLSEAGFSDFAGSTHRSLGRRLGCSRRRNHSGRSQGQVWSGRQGQPDPGFVDGSCHARHLHPLARLVRLQRRIAACHGQQSPMCPTSAASSPTPTWQQPVGVMAAIILTQIMYKKVDVTMALNGALAGLVSITAEPLMPSPLSAILIGAVGGVIVVFAVPMLDKFKIDDVVGAIPVHLLAGIWGTMAVPLTNDGTSFGTQLMGVVAYGVFTFVLAGIVWFILKVTIGIRPTEEEEMMGMDMVEVGVEAYPEFTKA